MSTRSEDTRTTMNRLGMAADAAMKLGRAKGVLMGLLMGSELDEFEREAIQGAIDDLDAINFTKLALGAQQALEGKKDEQA